MLSSDLPLVLSPYVSLGPINLGASVTDVEGVLGATCSRVGERCLFSNADLIVYVDLGDHVELVDVTSPSVGVVFANVDLWSPLAIPTLIEMGHPASTYRNRTAAIDFRTLGLVYFVDDGITCVGAFKEGYFDYRDKDRSDAKHVEQLPLFVRRLVDRSR